MTEWSIVIEPNAARDLDKLSKPNRKRVLRFLRDRVARLDHPRQIRSPLKGTFSDLWRYRVGDLRVLCRIEDSQFVILVVSMGNRGSIYR